MKRFVFGLLLSASLAAMADDGVAKFDSRMTVGKEPAAEGGMKWIDGRELPLEGRPFRDVESFYDRLPKGVTTNVNAGVRSMKHHTSGMQFRFSTGSRKLRLRWVPYSNEINVGDNLSTIGASGVDIYRRAPGGRSWRYVGTGRIRDPAGAEYQVNWNPGDECIVNLPLYNGVKSFMLGIDETASVSPLPPRRSGVTNPVVFYGTSITHGGCASRPGMSFVNIVGRDLDVPVVNLGFSGSGRMEFEMSEHLAAIDASCYVLDCLWNMAPDRLVFERYEPFIRNLRARRPDVPIVMAEQCDVFCGAPNDKDEFIRRLYRKLTAEGWRNLVYLPKTGMYCGDGEGTVDGCHPNDQGMRELARAFGGAVGEALGLPQTVRMSASGESTLTVHLPKGAGSTAAVVICPGGGYRELCDSYEGDDMARWLVDRGIAAFVLRYRLAPKHAGSDMLADIRNALRCVRDRSAEWRIDPRRVGVLGFSAGGHLACLAGTLDWPCRPDFMALVYPHISMTKGLGHEHMRKKFLGPDATEEDARRASGELLVSERTPPTFLVHARTDEVCPVEHSRRFAAAMREKGRPVEYLELESGRHGLGCGKGALWTTWLSAFGKWLDGLMLQKGEMK